jgi:hypothetical protein
MTIKQMLFCIIGCALIAPLFFGISTKTLKADIRSQDRTLWVSQPPVTVNGKFKLIQFGLREDGSVVWRQKNNE